MAVAIVVGFFFWYVGLSVMLVGIKSLYFGILVGPSFLIGMMGFGRALGYAKHCGTELFMHVVQLMVFEVYLAVSAIGLTWVLTTDVIGTSTATAIPRVLMMAVAAAVLWLGFRFVDHSFHAEGMGTIGRGLRGAWNAGTGAASEGSGPPGGARGEQADAAASRQQRQHAGDDYAQSGGSGTKPVPAMEWFKPRSSSSAELTPTTGSTTSGAAAHSAAKSTAKSVAKTAALDAAKVAAPEVAVPAAAAAKAAGAAERRACPQEPQGHQRPVGVARTGFGR